LNEGGRDKFQINLRPVERIDRTEDIREKLDRLHNARQEVEQKLNGYQRDRQFKRQF